MEAQERASSPPLQRSVHSKMSRISGDRRPSVSLLPVEPVCYGRSPLARSSDSKAPEEQASIDADPLPQLPCGLRAGRRARSAIGTLHQVPEVQDPVHRPPPQAGRRQGARSEGAAPRERRATRGSEGAGDGKTTRSEGGGA